MSRRLDRMRRAPQGDWTIADVEALCREFGVSAEPPRGGRSHYKISHPAVAAILTLPFKRLIKPIYIRKLVALIDEVRAAHGTAPLPDRD
ncbi:type II toxin-antitoxin system HicA family toxin [Antarcticirhabdus aurantiaca]|uniref:Type II toxin-antitoxin system HicA family toxin n=1 Tax=Antarcticirhabdus aurantiaca TaxID=2606717 RepID=A0ACD4NS63_9HYPH|nr:type II toxin-antitoxin system HicA family toxin [Antarcticirhabdus aurantiaca]WAJ29815.1 type II toxin-antitoxin system HicA family toxin [Jeongeuplla avenae]